MKILISGYGRMGKEVEQAALQRGHSIVAIIDNEADWNSKKALIHEAEIVIDFSLPDTATGVFEKFFEAGLTVVKGTTGWYADLDRINSKFMKINGTLF